MGNAATSQTLYIPRIRISIALIMAAVVLLSIASGDSTAFAQTPELATDNAFEFAFENEAEGWTADFADLPADFDQPTYELDSGFRALPESLSGNGFYIQGHKISDDLFMYLKRQVEGLLPSTTYPMTVEIDLATDVL